MVIVVQAAEQAELTVEMQLQVPAAVVEVGEESGSRTWGRNKCLDQSEEVRRIDGVAGQA
jgi:hypothetical protein